MKPKNQGKKEAFETKNIFKANLDLPQHLDALPDLRREGLQHIRVLP